MDTQCHSDVPQIRSVAALGGLEIEIAADYKHFEDNNKPDFRSKFPHGKIPALEGANGFNLAEGTAIARYRASVHPPIHRSISASGKTRAIYTSVIPVLTCPVDIFQHLTPCISLSHTPRSRADTIFIVATLSPNANLLGQSVEEQALVEQWIHFSESEIDNPTQLTRQLLNGLFVYNKAVRPPSLRFANLILVYRSITPSLSARLEPSTPLRRIC